MLNVAKDNTDLVTYLVSELASSKKARFESMHEFIPNIDPATGSSSRPVSACR